MNRFVSVLMPATSLAICVATAVYRVEQGLPSWYAWGVAALVFVLTIYMFTSWMNDEQG